jgi:Ser-tRNA(Ala) deacylase AlaX
MLAGIVSGYLSHVPHNLSTMKLMNPRKSYVQLFKEFAVKSEARLPESMSPRARTVCGRILSVLAPVGVHIRTTQIVGSFVILNGLIKILS